MLFDLIRGGYSMLEILAGVFASLFVVFCTLPFHEYAHALVATKLGDQTARLSGRLSLNPMRHIDPLGALMIVLVGFGYAKPVPVNPRNFKNPKVGMALTALAGPCANLLIAFVFFVLKYIILLVQTSNPIVFALAFLFIFVILYIYNIVGGNLLPIPPLDGSRILQLIIPSKYYFKFLQYERYVVIVVFVLLLTGILSRPLGYLQSLLYNGLDFLVSLPFKGVR